MVKMRTAFVLCSLLLIAAISSQAQQDVFARRAQIPLPVTEYGTSLASGAFGGVVSGVDFDGDGYPEIYAVNTDWNDEGNELIPRIYKFEKDTTTGVWDSVWSATLPIPLQNTWPTLTTGDWDSDGRPEIIWGPVNNLNATTNPNPARIVVFEYPGDGSDNMGVPDGAGGWRANATWTITDQDNFNLRPFRWFLTDVNFDGAKDLVFSSRAGWSFGVVDVSDIPDAGDSSETWTLVESSLDTNLTIAAGTYYDLAIVDSTIYLIADNGSITPIQYANGTWSSNPVITGVLPIGSWKSSSVVDLDGNGSKEIVIGGWSGANSNKIYLLEPSGPGLTGTMIADVSSMIGSGRLFGGAMGDIDGDGNMDFVFGTRSATPDAGIVRLQYLGGTITDPANYKASLIDSRISTGGRYGIVDISNLDSDADLEVAYANEIGGNRDPIVILDRIALPFDLISVSEARADTNGDFQPDRVGDTVAVEAIINSTNVQTTNFGYFMQDDNAGIELFQFGLVGAPALEVGDRVVVRGAIAYFRGTTEISPADLATDIMVIDKGRTITPIPLTIDQYRANSEMYESRSIELAVANPAGFNSSNWPAAGSSANLNIWGGGKDSTVLRLDSDTEVPGSPYPTFPVKLKGIGTQFTSSSSVHDNGYQITPFFVSDFTPIDAPPARYFPLLSPANNATWSVGSAGSYDFSWRKAVDFNGDNVIYQFLPIGFSASASNNSGADTIKTVTGSTLLGYLGSADSLNLKWTVLAKDPGNAPVANLDTFTVTIKKLVVVESMLDHITSRFQATVTNEGTIGSLNDFVGTGPGNGFQFPIGTQQLYGDGILVAIDSTHVSDAIRKPSGTPRLDADFRSLLNMDTSKSIGPIRIIETAFDDSMAESPFGVQIAQTTISIDSAGYDNILWFQLDLTNKSGGAYSGLTAGAFLDWDLVPGGGSDLGTVIVDSMNVIPGINSGNPFPFDIVEMHNGNSPTVWTAAVPLNTNRFYGRRIAINNGEVYGPSHPTEGDKWRYMTTLRAGNPNAGAAAPDDHSQVFGIGPYNLANNATQRVGFALIAANSVQELVNSARVAQQVWVQLFGNDLTLFVVGVASGSDEIPDRFDLAQNYPNPFNPSTTIRYSLPTQSAVSLTIYNVLGQKVASLVDEVKPAGVFEVVWNGRNEFGSQIASGVYFYRLEATPSQGGEPFTMFKKMMLLK